jgi:mannosyltransferase
MAVADTGELALPAPADISPARPRWRRSASAVRVYWLWPALIMLAAGAYRLGTPSLWADELATWGAVRLGWGQLFHLTGNVDAVVAPYYVVEKAWTGLAGTSPAALRMPSVLAMAAAAALVAILGARLHSRWVGLLAGLIFALAPATSRYAQEARPYSFAILLAVVATLLLTWLVERPGAAVGLAYALSVALLAAFHIIGLLLLLAHALVARRRLAAWLVWAGCGVVPVLPLMWLGYRQRGQVSWIPPATLHVVLGAPDVVFVSATVGGAVVALALLAFARRPNAVLLVSWALVPAVALALLGQVAPLFYARYLLFVIPAWVLLAALTLDRLPRAHALAVVVSLALLGAPTQNGMRAGNGHPTASADAGALIASNDLPGDAIAYQLGDTAPWEARDVVARYVPADRRPLDVFQVTPQRLDGRLAAVECADLAACLDRADPARMWILRKDTHADPLQGIGAAKEDLLRSRYRLSRLWLVRGMTIALYLHS